MDMLKAVACPLLIYSGLICVFRASSARSVLVEVQLAVLNLYGELFKLVCLSLQVALSCLILTSFVPKRRDGLAGRGVGVRSGAIVAVIGGVLSGGLGGLVDD